MDLIIGQNARPPSPGSRPAATAPGPRDPRGTAGAVPADDGIILDGDQNTFMADVIDASRDVPVLVDFWATWCGPCKTLTPALERVVRAAGGRLRLVKIDVDANRALVQQLSQLGLPLQSVPTVAAFWQGQIADMFQGAQPESEIKRFVEGLMKLAGGAMPAAEMAAEGRAMLEAGRPEEAANAFAAALEQDPELPESWGGLARALLALGEEDEASATLDRAPARIAQHAELSGARAAIALAAEGRRAAAGLAAFRARLEADPLDHAARFELSAALNGTGARAEAAEALLEILRRDRAWNEGAARLQLIRLFEAWGQDDPATLVARRRMSALLFS